MNPLLPICRSVDPFGKHEPEYSKFYLEEMYVLSFGLIKLPNDILTMSDWLYLNNAKKKAIAGDSQLLATYEESLKSDYSQSFIVHIKTGKKPWPIAQVEIEVLSERNVHEFRDVNPGDYWVQIILSPQIMRFKNARFNLVQLLSEYIFLHPEVDRIVTQLDEENRSDQDILIRAGFERISRVEFTDYRAAIFACTRETLGRHGLHLLAGEDGY